MPRTKKPELRFPLKLTLAQRKILAEIIPDFAQRLKLDEPNQRIVSFTVAELKTIQAKAGTNLAKASMGYERRPLRLILETTAQAIAQSRHLPLTDTVYQIKITLLECRPPVWRRIQVQDGTLDKLHEHIQTAMGWKNSHLHHFRIGDQLFGDQMLMEESFEEIEYQDSTKTMLSDIVRQEDGKQFGFQYEYDFGDSWQHEILFEGIVRAEAKVKYPLCLEGARACPPEDCGGVWGYNDFLEAIRNKDPEMMEWIGGRFNPEKFDPAKATKAMRRGLPGWRKMAWI